MKFRAFIAITICVSVFGSYIAPAFGTTCCCSSTKSTSSCCSIPVVEVEQNAAPCCQKKSPAATTQSATRCNIPGEAGCSGASAAIHCGCALKTKAPVVLDLRAGASTLEQSVAFVSAPYGDLVYADNADSFSKQYPSCVPNLHPILKSCSLRI